MQMIRIDKQKYVPLSSTLRKCKAIERKKDLKRERMFIMPNKQVRESVKMSEIKGRELVNDQDEDINQN